MEDKNRPDKRNSASEDMQADVTVMRDVVAGAGVIRDKGKVYLPKHQAEAEVDYDNRAEFSSFFGATGRTVEGLTGMVFRRDPEIDAPTRILTDAEDIDLQGAHISVFAKHVFSDAITAGHSCILVDAPQVGDSVKTRSDEQALGVRPYWVHVKLEDIYSWRTIREQGRTVLQQVVIREVSQEPEGLFGEKQVTRYRVLTRQNGIHWELFEDVKGKPVSVGEGTIKNVTEIPLVTIYANRTGYLESRPPLLDMAWINLSHYRVQSDHLWALHKTACSMLVLSGVDTEDRIPVGPNVLLQLPEGAKADMVGPGAEGFDATDKQLTKQETQMGVLGLSMLQHQTRASETAAAKRIDKAEQDSALSTTARSMQDGMEQAFKFHAQMLGLPDDISVVVNRDYERLSLDAQQVLAYQKLWAEGGISQETFWSILREGGALTDEFDVEVEIARLEGEMTGLTGAE